MHWVQRWCRGVTVKLKCTIPLGIADLWILWVSSGDTEHLGSWRVPTAYFSPCFSPPHTHIWLPFLAEAKLELRTSWTLRLPVHTNLCVHSLLCMQMTEFACSKHIGMHKWVLCESFVCPGDLCRQEWMLGWDHFRNFAWLCQKWDKLGYNWMLIHLLVFWVIAPRVDSNLNILYVSACLCGPYKYHKMKLFKMSL